MAQESDACAPINRRLGLIQIHTVALLVGFAGLFGKLLHAAPEVIVTGRTVFGSLALLAAIGLTRTPLRVRSRRDFIILVASGAILALHWYCFFRSIQVSTVAIGVLSFASFPVFITLLEPLLFRERLHVFDICIALVVVVGLCIVTLPAAKGSHIVLGMEWGIFSGLLYAVLSLISRSTVRNYSPMTVAFYQQSFAAFFALPSALAEAPHITLRTVLLLLTLGVVFTGTAQALLVASLRHIRAQTAGVIVSLEPVYGILFALLFLGELPAGRTLIGGLLVCLAVIAASLKKGG